MARFTRGQLIMALTSHFGAITVTIVTNWEDSKAYEFVQSLSWNAIAHEFRRRSGQYRSDYQSLKCTERLLRARYGTNTDWNDWFDDPIACFLRPPALPGESVTDWERRLQSRIPETPKVRLTLDEFFWRKYYLGPNQIVDPDRQPEIAPNTELFSCPRILSLQDLEVFADVYEYSNVRLVAVDPDLDLEAQFERIAKSLRPLRKWTDQKFMQRLPQTRDEIVHLLRLLDARAAGTRDEWTCVVLYGHPVCTDASAEARNKLSDDARMAEWLTNGGFRHLAARDDECWDI